MIQDHYATDCTNHEPPCPSNYNSAEAYKCNEFILFFLAIYKKKFDNNDIKEKQTLWSHFVINMPIFANFNSKIE